MEGHHRPALSAGGRRQYRHRHHLPRRQAADGSKPKAAQMRFAPNTGYAFAVGTDTWHSADPVHNRVKTRDSILLTYFVDSGLLRTVPQPRQAAGQFPAQRDQAAGLAYLPLVPAKAGTQCLALDSRLRGNERETGPVRIKAALTRTAASSARHGHHRRRRTILTALGLYIFAALFIGYFARQRLHRRARPARAGRSRQADRHHARRARRGSRPSARVWERRVSLLRSDKLDPDMLDERARALLGYVDPRDAGAADRPALEPGRPVRRYPPPGILLCRQILGQRLVQRRPAPSRFRRLPN